MSPDTRHASTTRARDGLCYRRDVNRHVQILRPRGHDADAPPRPHSADHPESIRFGNSWATCRRNDSCAERWERASTPRRSSAPPGWTGVSRISGVLINNESWRDTLAGILTTTLLLMPKCLRVEENARAVESSVVCKKCGLCPFRPARERTARLRRSSPKDGDCTSISRRKDRRVAAELSVVSRARVTHMEAQPFRASHPLSDDCIDTCVDPTGCGTSPTHHETAHTGWTSTHPPRRRQGHDGIAEALRGPWKTKRRRSAARC